MASTTGKTNPQYRPASRRPMPRNAPSGKPARPSREPVPQERYRTGTAKPKRRRMRSMKAHIWDTGVFFSVLLLLITGLIDPLQFYPSSGAWYGRGRRRSRTEQRHGPLQSRERP